MFAGKPAPFVMELPQYHIPFVKGVLLHVWERIWAFLKKAGTILFLCCVVMWLLSSFGFHNGTFGLVEPEHSLMAAIGGAIAIVFAPPEFDTWQAVTSSISKSDRKPECFLTDSERRHIPRGNTSIRYVKGNFGRSIRQLKIERNWMAMYSEYIL